MIKTLIRGSLLGLFAFALVGGLFLVLPPGVFQDVVLVPLLLVSGPALLVGKRAFGRDPIPQLIVLACSWAALGALLAGWWLWPVEGWDAQAATSESTAAEEKGAQ